MRLRKLRTEQIGRWALVLLFIVTTGLGAEALGQKDMGMRRAVGEQVFTGGSLALTYDFDALQKPGDFNKHYIRALVILDDDQPVGIKIAGHSEESICKQTTEIVIDLAKGLDGKKARFGTIDADDGYFASYGILDGPIDKRYRKPYSAAYAQLRALERSAPGKFELRTMQLGQYNRIRENILAKENAEAPHIYIHYLPESYIQYRPVGSFAPEAYSKLRQAVKNEVTRDYVQRVEAEQQNLQALIDVVKQVELPMQFRPYPNPRGIVENTPQRMQRYRSICDDALKKSTALRKLITNRKLLKRYQTEHAKLQNPYLKDYSKIVKAFLESLLEEGQLCTQLKESLIEMEEDQNFQADSIMLEWKPAELNNFVRVLERSLVNKKTFLQFSEGFGERHYDLLTDGTIRGWPALDPRQFKSMYEKGTNVRKQARAISQYHYIAPNNGQPQVGASVSGIVFQVVGQGQPQYYALQDFMFQQNDVPDVMGVARQIASSSQVPQKNIHVVRYDGQTVETPAPDILRIEGIDKNFVLLPAQQQLDSLREKTGLPMMPLQPGIASGSTFTVLDRGNLFLHRQSPFAVYAGDLLRHATRRATLDPKLSSKFGFAQTHVPLNAPIVTEEVWYGFKFGQLPKGSQTLVSAAQATPARRTTLAKQYARLMLQLPLELRDLPSASPNNTFANSFVGLYDAIIKSAQTQFGEDADAWNRDQQDYVGFVRDLVNGLYTRRNEQITVIAHQPDPLRVFVNGQAAYLTDFTHDGEKHYAAHLAQVFAHMALIRHTDAKPLTNAQLQPIFDELVALATAMDYIPDNALSQDDFQGGMVMGMLQLLPYFEQQRIGYSTDAPEVQALNTRIANVYQPAFKFLLQQSEAAGISEGQAFLMRNLGLVIGTLEKEGFVYAK